MPAAALALALVVTLAVPPSLRGREVERVPTASRTIALTFDGGDNAAAAGRILRVLRAQRVPATFFVTGRFVERYPRLAQAIGREYPVGNHSFAHAPFTRMSSAAAAADIRRAERAIRRRTGRDPRPLFRFPYGDRDRRTIAVANRLGYVSVRWSIDTWGWMGRSRMSRGAVVRRVTARLEPGAIVLLHLGAARDGSTLDAAALPEIIAAARRRGYTFTSLERLGQRR
ncbi:MAG: polysaccharide deacetylase family protein [Thermoleophilia bacterium]|nr:polysaccharide deacetylase family protein [Thermoleophilia bacterium]